MPSTDDLAWFCCNCSTGPQSFLLEGCPDCGHWTCRYCDKIRLPKADSDGYPDLVLPEVPRLGWPSTPLSPLEESSNVLSSQGEAFNAVTRLEESLNAVSQSGRPGSVLKSEELLSTELFQSREPSPAEQIVVRGNIEGQESIAPVIKGEPSPPQLDQDPHEAPRKQWSLSRREASTVALDCVRRIAAALWSEKEPFQQLRSIFEGDTLYFGSSLFTYIGMFAKELKEEAESELQSEAACFISCAASLIAWTITAELGRIETAPDLITFYSLPSQETLLYLQSMEGKQFIRGSRSLQRLILRLDQIILELHGETQAQGFGNANEGVCLRSPLWQKICQIGRVIEPKPQAGTVRIRWRCSCGAMMWDDFPARSPDDVKRLQVRLNSLFRKVANGQGSAQRSPNTFSPLQLLQRIGNSFRTLIRALDEKREWQHDAEKSTPAPTQEAGRDNDGYFLTCIDGLYGLPVLYQERLAHCRNDTRYFQMLRALYETGVSGWRKWLTFDSVVAIEYVKVCHPAPKWLFGLR